MSELRRIGLTLLIAVAAVSAVSGLEAQTLVVEGGGADLAAITARQILARENFQVFARDTVIPAESRILGDLVVLDARVALEGRVEGAVVVVEGDFFVRPEAFVGGPIVVLGGDAYVAGRSTTGGLIRIDPRIAVELDRAPPTFTLILREPPGPGLIRLPGMFGARLPTYDRVNGMSLGWGGELGTGGDTATIALLGTANLRLARRRIDGSVDLRLNPAFRTVVGVRASRTTRTDESWIRGDLANTLSALSVGSDVRDYFESDAIALYAARTPPASIVAGEGFVVPSLHGTISHDRSLPARQVWSLLRSRTHWRPNPPIEDGTLASVTAAAAGEWRGPTARFSGGAGIEWAPGILSDFEFAQLTASGRWSMEALWDHRIRLFGFVRLPLGSSEAPLQRWSFVGGSGTLPTFDTGFMRGDHVLFLNSVYTAPIPFVQLPLIGSPTLRLEHATGAAWRTGNPRPLLEQNAGVGLQVSVFHGLVFINPAERPLRPILSLGIDMPTPAPLPRF